MHKKFNLGRTILLIVAGIIIFVCALPIGQIIQLSWEAVHPRSSGRFEMTGEFQRLETGGSLHVGAGPAVNTVDWNLILNESEANRVQKYKDYGPSYSTPWPVDNRPGFFWYGHHSTGDWCGPLPSEGDEVIIKSPTGYTKSVTIEDLNTGEIYRSNCDQYPPVSP